MVDYTQQIAGTEANKQAVLQRIQDAIKDRAAGNITGEQLGKIRESSSAQLERYEAMLSDFRELQAGTLDKPIYQNLLKKQEETSKPKVQEQQAVQEVQKQFISRQVSGYITQKPSFIERLSGIEKKIPIYSTYVTDAQGNKIRLATEEERKQVPNVLQAVTKEQIKQEQNKPLSSIYEVPSYLANKVINTPEFQITSKVLGVDKELNKPFIAGDYNIPTTYGDIPLGQIGKTFVETAPLFVFEPFMRTGVQDVKIKTYPREPKSQAVENQVLVRMPDGSLKTYSSYEIKTKSLPPEVKVTTGLREVYGLDEQAISLGLKPKTNIVKTPFYSEAEKPFNVIEMSQRKKGISSIEGINKPINIKQVYSNLNPVDKRLIDELLGNVPEKLKLKMLEPEESVLLGDITKTEIYSGARTTKLDFKELVKGLQKEGAREEVTRFAAKVKELELPPEAPYEIYKTDITFKKAPKPFARASGKISSMETTARRLKEPIDFEFIKDLNDFQAFSLELKANLDKTINNVKAQIQEAIPKFKPTIITPTEVKPLKLSSAIKETIKVAESKPISVAIPLNNILKEQTKFVEEIQTSVREDIAEFAKVYSGEKPKNKEQEVIKQVDKNLEKSISKVLEEEQSKFLSQEKSKMQEKLQQKQMQKQMQKLMEKEKTKVPEETIPELPIASIRNYPKGIIGGVGTQREKVEKETRSLGTGYWVYIKQIQGTKLVKVNNSPVTKERAQDIGAYLTDTSVARTFQVKKANKPAREDYEFIAIPEGYYKQASSKLRNYKVKQGNPYNLDMERFIEKQKFVGDTPEEIKQLNSFRKQVQATSKF